MLGYKGGVVQTPLYQGVSSPLTVLCFITQTVDNCLVTHYIIHMEYWHRLHYQTDDSKICYQQHTAIFMPDSLSHVLDCCRFLLPFFPRLQIKAESYCMFLSLYNLESRHLDYT